jgi:hypothetical protein
MVQRYFFVSKGLQSDLSPNDLLLPTSHCSSLFSARLLTSLPLGLDLLTRICLVYSARSSYQFLLFPLPLGLNVIL